MPTPAAANSAPQHLLHGRTLAVLVTVGAAVSAAVLGFSTHSTGVTTSATAPTPMMGFGNWTGDYCDGRFNEDMLKGIADATVAKGLRELGYNYIVIDGCWALPERDNAGQLVADPLKFPSGIGALADYVHERQLKLAISPPISPETCTADIATSPNAAQPIDAEQFTAWGVDMVTPGNCEVHKQDSAPTTGTEQGHATDWQSVVEFVRQNSEQRRGHRVATDAIHFGAPELSEAQQRSQFSLWAMFGAPLLIETDLPNLQPEAKGILANADVIAVSQDDLRSTAQELYASEGLHAIARPLMGGDIAVALFNETDTEATISADLSLVGFGAGRYVAKDLWAKSTQQGAGSTISASVPGYSTTMYRVSAVSPRPTGRWSVAYMVEQHGSNGWGPHETNRSNGNNAADDGGPLSIHGKTFRRGLGVHAPSDVEYYLGRTCSNFSAWIGIDDEANGRGSAVFQVFADDRLIADSGRMTGSMPARQLSVALPHPELLRLVVTDAGDGIDFDHADWADAELECS